MLLAGALLIASKNGNARPALVLAAASFVVLALPTYVGNMWLYGDPLWPFLQRFVPNTDPVALDFAWYIRNFGSSIRSLRHYAVLPLELVAPLDAGRLGNALGVGCLAGIIAICSRRANRYLLLAAAVVAILVLTLGQLTPRFFIEPYLWCGAAVAAIPWESSKRLLSVALTIQLTVMSAVAVYATFVLFPGSLSPGWRQRVMDGRAPGSAVCRWMDAILPCDAVVASTTRSHALYPRAFIASDFARFLDRTNLNASEKRHGLITALRSRGVNVLVVQLPVESGPYAQSPVSWDRHWDRPPNFRKRPAILSDAARDSACRHLRWQTSLSRNQLDDEKVLYFHRASISRRHGSTIRMFSTPAVPFRHSREDGSCVLLRRFESQGPVQVQELSKQTVEVEVIPAGATP